MKRKLQGVEIPLLLFAFFIDFILDPAVDLLTFGFGGFVVDAIAAFTFKHWLERYNVELYGPKNGLMSTIITVLEALPYISFLPLWTLRIVALVIRDASTNGRV
jgi:hypothetical protein